MREHGRSCKACTVLCTPQGVLSTTQRPALHHPGEASARFGHLIADNYPADTRGLQRVTRIVGTEAYLLEPQLLAAALQRRFAAAAGANTLPGAKAGGACEVVIQGDVAAKVRAGHRHKVIRERHRYTDYCHLCSAAKAALGPVRARVALLVSSPATAALLLCRQAPYWQTHTGCQSRTLW